MRVFCPPRRIPLLLSLLLFLQPGCSESLRWAVGSTETAGLVTSFDPADLRISLVTGIVSMPVAMVRSEGRFRVEPIPAPALARERSRKALVVVTDASDPGSLRSMVDDLISKATRDSMAANAVDYRIIENAWARGQAVLLVHANDAEALTQFVKLRGQTMIEAYEERLQIALAPAVLAAGRRTEVERHLSDAYGFTLGVPTGYEMGEDANGRVVRLSRTLAGEPARFLMIHWMPVEDAPEGGAGLLELRDRLGLLYNEGDVALPERSSWREGRFQNLPAILLEGVWQNEKHVIGGPFRSFGFVRGDRYYFVDVSVFNPPGPKLPFLREGLALARTFSPAGG